MPGKMARRPSVISKINSADSETLILSPSQFRRQKQKTVEAVKAIHCGSHVYTCEKEQAKSIKNRPLDNFDYLGRNWRDESIYPIPRNARVHLFQAL